MATHVGENVVWSAKSTSTAWRAALWSTWRMARSLPCVPPEWRACARRAERYPGGSTVDIFGAFLPARRVASGLCRHEEAADRRERAAPLWRRSNI